MLASPWDLVLSLTFSFTALVCLGGLLAHRSRSGAESSGLTDSELIDVNHAVMSVAMIAMIWVPVIDVVTWAQVALFGVLSLALLPGYSRAGSLGARIDLGGHVALNAAMIWMLAAMPLLMAGAMEHSSGSAHAGHGSDAGGVMAMETPGWADVVNNVAVVVSAIVALWWFSQFAMKPGHRLHALCHTVMAAGMAWMLVLMNL